MTFPELRLAKRPLAALCLTGFVCLALYPLGLPAADLARDNGPGYRSAPVAVSGTRDAGFELLPPAGEVAAIEFAWASGKKRVPIEPGQSEVVVTELQNP
tara:strand:- start:303 stop:602 length:300 start_codon:yes stop_codon:yes gene_type:complete